MTGDLATVIDATRVGAFVGRSTEVATFRSALAGHDSLRVLFIRGPGGIGKTTLLHQFGIRARNAGRTVVALDGRDVDCSPQGFLDAFDGAGNPARATDPFVLLVDGHHRLFALDPWVRQTFIPLRPSDCVVVLVSPGTARGDVAHGSRLACARRCPSARPAGRGRERRPGRTVERVAAGPGRSRGDHPRT